MSLTAGTTADRSLLRAGGRVLTVLAGVSTVLVGLLLVPLPGPGWPVVFVGISLLGKEFAWARRLSGRVRDEVGRARARFRSRTARAALSAFGLLSVVAPVLLLLR